ncbi:uncharacterized protein MYCFIDRAFT_211380 [Pseudocercospora fijiensis CIRAD86]|uniref:F-box domain-containing protein n=1 Tax=Pseudocercospora fijiensis (strain CIRAD86) TaxID=383855 RepID=M3AGD3_PSEFD|nr:uncharacterized protein MYCFIDRAFT_211380 [Pseudocercospora fijiensis CIRAD86]EME83641.1 hypothetical protein MYCFIDRAFT_211380 [Pseudocercospora fijiensis CIRAD86]
MLPPSLSGPQRGWSMLNMLPTSSDCSRLSSPVDHQPLQDQLQLQTASILRSLGATHLQHTLFAPSMAFQKLSKESAKLLSELKNAKILKAKEKKALREKTKRKALLKDSKVVALPHLPLEIWYTIGKFAIDAEDEISNRWSKDKREQNALMRQPGITRTCKLLRDELLPYWYATKATCELWEFSFSWADLNIPQWLRMIGPEARRRLGRAYLLLREPGHTDSINQLLGRKKHKSKIPFTLSEAVPWKWSDHKHRRLYKNQLPTPDDLRFAVGRFRWMRKVTFT